MQLEVREGDIAALEVDAVANAANDHLWMGAGVAGALKRAGGEEIEQEAIAKGPIPVGTAVATAAGRLSARHVIHGAVMGQDLRTSPELVRRTTRACLELADGLGCGSLALPAFGTGVGGLGVDECADAMVGEALRFAPSALELVIFAVYGADAARAFKAALSGHRAGMSEHEDEQRKGRFAVPGPESADSDETLSPDERGVEPQPTPPPAPPSGPPRPRKLRWPFRR